MEENCRILIKACASYPDHEHNSDFAVRGFYVCKNNRHYIAYREKSRGMEGIYTLLKIRQGKAEMTRPGLPGAGILSLSPGQETLWIYDTGQGKIELNVKCHRAESDLGDIGGKVYLCYSLFSEGEKISKNTVKLTVRGIK